VDYDPRVELRFALLADAAVPAEAGKVNIFGAGIEAIFAASVPVIHSAITLVVMVSLARGEASEPHSFEVRVTAPDGRLILQGGGRADSAEPEQLARLPEDGRVNAPMLLPLANLALPSFGRYEIALTWDGDPVVTVPLMVARPPEE
jgi:hypothetical protein